MRSPLPQLVSSFNEVSTEVNSGRRPKSLIFNFPLLWVVYPYENEVANQFEVDGGKRRD